MKIEQQRWTKVSRWTPSTGSGLSAQLVLVFASRPVLQEPGLLQGIKKLYPDAHTLGCSTAGEICGTRVFEDTAIATAVSFENSHVKGASVRLREVPDSFQAGQFLAEAIPDAVPGQQPGKMEQLVHVMVLSDGLAVNGSRIKTRKTGKRLSIPIAPPLKAHIESLPAGREGYLHPKAGGYSHKPKTLQDSIEPICRSVGASRASR